MHQTADTSFLARRGLGFWLVFGLGEDGCFALTGEVLAVFAGRSAAALASRASLRSRLLR